MADGCPQPACEQPVSNVREPWGHELLNATTN